MGLRLGGIHSVARELGPDAAALHYERRLDELPKSSRGLPTLDLVLLGLGNDGHTASLFPKVDCVTKDAPRGWVTHVTHVKSNIGQRLSLTLEILNNARHALFVVVGLEKAKALQLALTTETRSVPASLVRLVNGSVEWYVDKGACVALEEDRWLAGVP
jgi:6-phosphogluconolactonase